jgi:two-component system, cell cycle sensor histidine kinase and response regulator CckA
MAPQNLMNNKTAEAEASRLASIVESSTDAIYSYSLTDEILTWNDGAQRIFGFTAKEAIGKNLSLIVPPGQKPEYLKLLDRIKKGEVISNHIAVRKTKQENEVLLSLSISPIKDNSGKINRIAVIARDVTDVERALSVKDKLSLERDQLLKRFQLQMECMPIACVLADANGHFTYWNPAAERTFGYFFKEVEGKKLEDNFLPPSDLSRTEASFERLQKGDRTIQGEVSEHRRKDGKTIQCEWYVTPMKDEKGTQLGIMGMALDITERRKAEAVQAQLAAILQQTTDAVFGSDLEGRILSWNRGAELMLGYHLEEILGENTSLLVPANRKEEMEKLRELATKEENISNYETEMLKRNGSLIEVAVTVSPIKDAKGKIVGISNISRDITERKSTQEALRKNEEQLQLSQKMDAIGRLAGGVAHDFNNLLNVIEGNSDFLGDALPPGDPHQEEVEEIKKAVHQGAQLTHQLLAFGKKQISQPQLVNLNELGSDMCKMFKRLIDASIDFNFVQDKNLKWIQSDPGQIQQIMLNLVLNARDAMPNGGKLVVATKSVETAEPLEVKGLSIPPGSYVGLTVTDTGTGIDLDTQDHLFEPFFTTKGDKGTGLGLATVWGIVNQWEGYIWLYSTPGLGTTFSIYFPAIGSEAATDAQEAEVSSPVHGTETILVAEDEEPLRKIMVRSLEKYGYHVLQAGNGIEALQAALNFKDTIQLLLTDTVMPKMNGKLLAEELKRSRPNIAVLFMSGYPLEVLTKQGTIIPSIHLIQKPFSNVTLAKRVRAVLDHEKESAETTIAGEPKK